MHRGTRTLLAVATVVTAVVLAGCAGDDPDNTAQPPGSATSGPFAQIDKATRELVATQVTWQAPAALDVESTERIALAIGSGQRLKEKIDALVPGAVPTSVGELEVGPTMRATLRGNPEDVEITPSVAVNASTGSDVQLLWTWLIHPKHPTDRLPLTAFLEVPLSDGHVITHEVALSIEVRRTTSYTLWQVATHWGTWSAIVTSLIGVVSWLIRRRKKNGEPAEAPEPSVANAAA